MQFLPSVEFTLQLELMMADHLGCLCPPTFSWDACIVMHMLKSDPMLRDLKHIQVDGPGMTYLFFFDKQGRCGLRLRLRLPRLCRHTLQRHLQSGFPALPISLSTPPPSCGGVALCGSGIRVMQVPVTGQVPRTGHPYSCLE